MWMSWVPLIRQNNSSFAWLPEVFNLHLHHFFCLYSEWIIYMYIIFYISYALYMNIPVVQWLILVIIFFTWVNIFQIFQLVQFHLLLCFVLYHWLYCLQLSLESLACWLEEEDKQWKLSPNHNSASNNFRLRVCI